MCVSNLGMPVPHKDNECKIEVWIQKDDHLRSSSQKTEGRVYQTVGQVSPTHHLRSVLAATLSSAFLLEQVSLRMDQVSSFADARQPQWFTLGNPAIRNTTTPSRSINVPQVCL